MGWVGIHHPTGMFDPLPGNPGVSNWEEKDHIGEEILNEVSVINEKEKAKDNEKEKYRKAE